MKMNIMIVLNGIEAMTVVMIKVIMFMIIFSVAIDDTHPLVVP